VTLYEACAIGVPVVATALTAAQSLTIRAVADAGAAVDGGPVDGGIRRVAGHVAHLLRARPDQQRMALAGRALVDGRGVFRVADRLRDLAEQGRGASHAA
jgi:spore coat polysaccharide biosynthesis predicted glycosyltransferase SpsG